MMKVTGFHPEADAEVTDAAQYYQIRQIGNAIKKIE